MEDENHFSKICCRDSSGVVSGLVRVKGCLL